MKTAFEILDSHSVELMLSKLSMLWANRAAVNNKHLDYADLVFDATKSDFSESLLPFRNHDAWKEAPEIVKSRCLSYAWGIYNLKTIYIECDVVTPACEDIIKCPPTNSKNRARLQDVMSEALLDEALHTRMSIMACNYIYDRRKLEHLNYTDFNLIKARQVMLSDCTAEWQRRLTCFAVACASETLITDYLKVMAEDCSIQNICHEVTKTHAHDEWSHSSVFSYVAYDIVRDLGFSERKYMRDIMLRTVNLFADNELGSWKEAFKLSGMPHARDIIEETDNLNEIQIYLESAEAVITRIGL
ncbi:MULTISPECIES: diiron oxygenase [Providencia]|uniref:Diiron oxygenase n=1 Tax=Providencia huaxiensis TaxID=2027290 RepID=A0ABU2ISA0_9GAMM|nr:MULTISPECIES: diiron oxygenase [Providencia]MBZ3680910.1 diiron oxygenase [Providencia rettgeri]MDT0131948.1 diiron oxygenase [Providencia huaxiensis]MDT1978354.1 diiron oxygenase [Providencia huaxiensis]QLR01494.1 diiron oxygenase [Providencia rettgeri]